MIDDDDQQKVKNFQNHPSAQMQSTFRRKKKEILYYANENDGSLMNRTHSFSLKWAVACVAILKITSRAPVVGMRIKITKTKIEIFTF